MMNPSSACHRLAAAASIILSLLALSAADARRGHVAHAAPGPLLTVYRGGCHFSPAVATIFQRFAAKLPARPPYKGWLKASFAFGALHGVGIAIETHSDFRGQELYFREDQAALKRALTASGLHIVGHGDIAEAAKFVDKKGTPLVGISIHGINGRAHPHFPAARSWLGCGAF